MLFASSATAAEHLVLVAKEASPHSDSARPAVLLPAGAGMRTFHLALLNQPIGLPLSPVPMPLGDRSTARLGGEQRISSLPPLQVGERKISPAPHE